MTLVATFFNWDVFVDALPALLRGFVNTLLLGIAAMLFGLVVGLVLALVRLYGVAPLRLAAISYIDVFRAAPVLVVLILIYYALPFVGIRFSSWTSATLALSVVMAAYSAEVFRAGIQSIPSGQFEAAAALGLPFWKVLRLVVLPQAFRIVIPPTTSNCISLFKDTSLASAVAFPELLKEATDSEALHANPTPLIGAAVIYILFLLPLVRLVSWLEKRFSAEKRR
jgi:polar amino acid transport system permease protein